MPSRPHGQVPHGVCRAGDFLGPLRDDEDAARCDAQAHVDEVAARPHAICVTPVSATDYVGYCHAGDFIAQQCRTSSEDAEADVAAHIAGPTTVVPAVQGAPASHRVHAVPTSAGLPFYYGVCAAGDWKGSSQHGTHDEARRDGEAHMAEVTARPHRGLVSAIAPDRYIGYCDAGDFIGQLLRATLDEAHADLDRHIQTVAVTRAKEIERLHGPAALGYTGAILSEEMTS